MLEGYNVRTCGSLKTSSELGGWSVERVGGPEEAHPGLRHVMYRHERENRVERVFVSSFPPRMLSFTASNIRRSVDPGEVVPELDLKTSLNVRVQLNNWNAGFHGSNSSASDRMLDEKNV